MLADNLVCSPLRPLSCWPRMGCGRERRLAYDDHPEGGSSLTVKIGPGPGGSDDFKLVTVLGVASPGAFGGYHQLVVKGQDHGDYLGFGKWYFVDGRHRGSDTAQSGTWDADAQPHAGS